MTVRGPRPARCAPSAAAALRATQRGISAAGGPAHLPAGTRVERLPIQVRVEFDRGESAGGCVDGAAEGSERVLGLAAPRTSLWVPECVLNAR